MDRYSHIEKLGSYTVNKSLIISIEDYLIDCLPKMLENEGELTSLINICVYHLNNVETYGTIRDLVGEVFNDDVKAIVIEVLYFNKKSERGAAIIIRLNKSKSDCDLSIAVQANLPMEKVIGLKSRLINILKQRANKNSWLFEVGPVSIALIILIFFLSIFALFIKTKIGVILCITTGIMLMFYIAIFKYFKGYCIFESNKQKHLDNVFNWITIAITGFALTSLLTIFRRALIGY